MDQAQAPAGKAALRSVYAADICDAVEVLASAFTAPEAEGSPEAASDTNGGVRSDDIAGAGADAYADAGAGAGAGAGTHLPPILAPLVRLRHAFGLFEDRIARAHASRSGGDDRDGFGGAGADGGVEGTTGADFGAARTKPGSTLDPMTMSILNEAGPTLADITCVHCPL